MSTPKGAASGSPNSDYWQNIARKLKDPYAEYKLATKQVIRWLVTTGSSLKSSTSISSQINNSEIGEQTNQHQSKKSLLEVGKEAVTGKKKSKAKKRAAKCAAEAKALKQQEKIISLLKLVQLCKRIGESKAKVPVWVFARFASIFWQRKAVWTLYSPGEEEEEEEEINKLEQNSRGHTVVARFMSRAWEVLGGNEWMLGLGGKEKEELDEIQELGIPLSGKDILISVFFLNFSNQQADAPTPIDDLEGEVETYDLVYSAGEFVDITGLPSVDSPIRKAQFGDKEIAILHFLRHMAMLRQYLFRLWENVCPAGPITTITASFVTNRAVEVVKSLEKRLQGHFNDINGFEGLCDVFYPYFRDFPNDGLKSHSMERFRYKELYWSNYDLLMDFVQDAQSGKALQYRAGIFRGFNPEVDTTRSDYALHEGIVEDRVILRNYLPDLIEMNNIFKDQGEKLHEQAFYGDFGLGRDIRKLINNKAAPVPMSLIWEMQLMLELVYAQRCHLDAHVKRMRDFHEFIQCRIDTIIKDHKGDMAEFIGKAAGMLVKLQCWLGQDLTFEVKKETRKDITEWDKDVLWKFNPWLTNNAIADAAMDYWAFGINLFSKGGAIGAVMHLWNFLKVKGYFRALERNQKLPTNSPTMIDVLMHHFGPIVFGSTTPPKDNFMKRWITCRGGNPENFGKSKKNKARLSNVKGNYNDWLPFTNSTSSKTSTQQTSAGPHPALSAAYTFAQSQYTELAPEIEELEKQQRKAKLEMIRQMAQSSGDTEAISLTTRIGNEFTHVSAPLEIIRHVVDRELGIPTGFEDPGCKLYPLISLDLVAIHCLCRDVLRGITNDQVFGPTWREEMEWYGKEEERLPWAACFVMGLPEEAEDGGKATKSIFEHVARVVWRAIGRVEVSEVIVKLLASDE